MKNQTAAAIATIAQNVDWEKTDLDLQAIIEAGNQGVLGTALTDWLVSKSWTNSNAQPKTTSILEFISTVTVSATTSKFIAKDKFVVNTKRNAPVKISAVWDNFTSWFLSGDGKTEDPISEHTLHYHKLRKSSVDGPIITELGGEAKAEITLSEMFSLMVGQKNGEDGTLLNNGYANIFYIRDQNCVLRAVDVDWDDDGWLICAYSVEGPSGWFGGDLVFSRNSVLNPSATRV